MTPPILVGNAGGPCVFMPTARLGKSVSKRRKKEEGTTKNTRRTASVPMISTLSGGCERTRVDHVI